jgi:hypothetical protein
MIHLREVAQAQCGDPFGIDLQLSLGRRRSKRKVRNPNTHFLDLRIGRDGTTETQSPAASHHALRQRPGVPQDRGQGPLCDTVQSSQPTPLRMAFERLT